MSGPKFGAGSAVDTLEALANGHPQNRIDDFTLWAFNQPSS